MMAARAQVCLPVEGMTMRSRLFGLAAALVCLAAGAPVAAAPTGVPLIDEVVQLADRHFYRPDVSEEFRAAIVAAAAELPQPATPSDIKDLIAETLDSLGISHTGFFATDHPAYYELLDILRANYRDRLRARFPGGRVTYEGVGFAPVEIGGRFYVERVYDGSSAAAAEILVGDEIVSADGVAFAPNLSFAGKAGSSVRLGLRRSEGAPLTYVDVQVRRLQPTESLLAAIRASVRVIDRGNRRVGYLRLWTFHDSEVMEIIAEALSGPELQGIDGLVLDLRGRWGGAPPDAAEIFLGGAPAMRVTERDGSTRFVTFRWRGPMVALTDSGTRSGMEILAYALKAGGIRLVGERTAGALLAGQGFLLSDGSLLELAVLDVDLGGVRLEGDGVAPDIEVPFALPYAAGADPQLEAALTTLTTLLDPPD
jgi:C-terminal processing protease CtpA/Prc